MKALSEFLPPVLRGVTANYSAEQICQHLKARTQQGGDRQAERDKTATTTPL